MISKIHQDIYEANVKPTEFEWRDKNPKHRSTPPDENTVWSHSPDLNPALAWAQESSSIQRILQKQWFVIRNGAKALLNVVNVWAAITGNVCWRLLLSKKLRITYKTVQKFFFHAFFLMLTQGCIKSKRGCSFYSPNEKKEERKKFLFPQNMKQHKCLYHW